MAFSNLSLYPPESSSDAPSSLDVLFAPKTVAVFVDSDQPGSPSRALMYNLLHHPFGGEIFPIHPECHSIHGILTYPSLADVPETAEMAIVAMERRPLPEILAECHEQGVKVVVVLAHQCDETELASGKYGSMRVLGPNSCGVASPQTGMNATFAKDMIPGGKVGFLGQGRELLTALVSSEHSDVVGCSKFLSVGSLMDIGWEDCLRYLADDPETECIGIYMEHLGDPRAFFLTMREVAARKPVVLLKGNTSLRGQSLREEVFEEACRCCGVLRVHRLNDLFRMTSILMSQPATQGNRLAIVTNDRGPALLAANALTAARGRLADWSPEVATAISQALGRAWDQSNPIDLGDYIKPERLGRVASLALSNPGTDALLIVVSREEAADPVLLAESVRDVVAENEKPVLASWMWGAANPESLTVLREAGIPICYSPEAAIRIFGYLWQHSENLRCLEEIRSVLAEAKAESVNREKVADVVSDARGSGQLQFTADDARSLFMAYGLSVQQTWQGTDEELAVQAATEVGFPVLMEFAADWQIPKIAGGHVGFRASNAEEVRRTWRTLNMIAREQFQIQSAAQISLTPIHSEALELVLTSKVEGDLGPVICLSKRGTEESTPEYGRSAIAPLTSATARQLLEHIPSLVHAGHNGSGKPYDLEALEKFLLGFSQLVVEQSGVREISISSLRVLKNGVVACTPEVLLHSSEPTDSQVPFLFCRQEKGAKEGVFWPRSHIVNEHVNVHQ
ncbi:MAG: acetate--CoA ligase family protein [Gemmataceae bacterium]